MDEPQSPAYAVGALVQLSERPAYLKTADPMPMLRPPDLVDSGEVGQVVSLKALGQLAVRFRRGTFLLNSDQLCAAAETAPPAERPNG
jgi:hypothetical protein